MALLGFVALKFIAYYVVCLAAVPLLHVAGVRKPSFALRWAAFRLLLGLLLGLFILLLFGELSATSLSGPLACVLSFVVVRYLAWLCVLLLISRAHQFQLGIASQGWVLLGVAASVVLDGLAIWSGLDQTKLFC